MEGRRGRGRGVIKQRSDGSATGSLGGGCGGIIGRCRCGGRGRWVMSRDGWGACYWGIEDSIPHGVETGHLGRLLEGFKPVVVSSERARKETSTTSCHKALSPDNILFRAQRSFHAPASKPRLIVPLLLSSRTDRHIFVDPT
jgi:hypothetical protein